MSEQPPTADCVLVREQMPVGARVRCYDGVQGTVIAQARDVYTTSDLGPYHWLTVEVCVQRDDRPHYNWINVTALR